MKQIRLYADTSVFGGYFDEEFAEDTRELFDAIEAGRFTLILSATTARELRLAPDHVRNLMTAVPERFIEMIPMSDEIARLRDAYLFASVVSEASRLDAEHIASASVARVDVIVSWNFRHIVHFDKIRGYHAVNLLQGYPLIPIHSPKEVIPA